MKSAATRALQVVAIAVFAALALLAPATAAAQEARGTSTWRVRDANDAVMPGASVKITNVAMGTTVMVTTSEAGLFRATYLIPGKYQIVVEVSGFKKYVRSGLELRIGETVEVDVQLE